MIAARTAALPSVPFGSVNCVTVFDPAGPEPDTPSRGVVG